jgi:hypothetical protein
VTSFATRDATLARNLRTDPTLGNKSIKDITTEDVRKIHAKVAAAASTRIRQRAQERTERKRRRVSGVAAKAAASKDWKGHRTANKVVALLRAILAFTGRRGENPAREVAWSKQSPRRRRLTDEEAQRFRKVLEGFEPAWRPKAALGRMIRHPTRRCHSKLKTTHAGRRLWCYDVKLDHVAVRSANPWVLPS